MLNNVEETLFIELPNGKNIPVSALHPNIKQHIKVIDKLRDDVAQKNYELQIYQLALQLKKQVLNTLLASMYPEEKQETSEK